MGASKMNKWHKYILIFFMFSNSYSAFSAQGHYVVAKSGGDFTTINAALAMGSSCSYPTVIDIMPGIYYETLRLTGSNQCTHLRGAGMDLTTISSPGGTSTIISVGVECTACRTPYSITVSDVTVSGTGQQSGIGISYGSLVLSDSRVIYTINATGASYGSMTVRNSILENNVNGALQSYGTMSIESSIIRNNSGMGIYAARSIINNQIYSNDTGISFNPQDSPTPTDNISGNIIKGNKTDGMYVGTYTNLAIRNNTIINNGRYDINAIPGYNLAVLTSNIYDKIFKGNLRTTYNIKSDGTPWP